MFRALLVALLLTFALVPTPATADPADISAASRSVVRIVIVQTDGDNVYYVGHGSGVAIAPNLVLTNAHVVEALRNDDSLIAGVVPSEGRKGYLARLSAFSPGNDLALLKLAEAGSITPATLFPGQMSDGADVFAVGYPGNVDAAQGLDLAQIIQPQAAVKTRGNLSAGRSSNAFETLLHTAPIGTGNSGGPLLDACGRVIGINSFGTVSQNGTDSPFFFAVSMREIANFLKKAGVTPRVSGLPCRSIAELNQAESERSTAEQARIAAQEQLKANAAAKAREAARTAAERDVLTERDNLLALAALLLVGALASGGFAMLQAQRNPKTTRKASIAAGVLVLAAILTWILRPSLDTIDTRTDELLPQPDATASTTAKTESSGPLICVIDTERSRVTVSDVTDVPFEWTDTGCVNGRTQYGYGSDGWSRILVPNGEETVSVNSYDPDTRTYKVERFLLGFDAMQSARQERGKFTTPTCESGEEGARKLGESQAAIKALLPPEPNERLLYKCNPLPGAR